MDLSPNVDARDTADLDITPEQHATHVLSHLEGALDDDMLSALSGVWSTLEHAATNPAAHARAVRARLFWETLAPGGVAAAPGLGLVASEPRDDFHDEPWEPSADLAA